MGRKRTEIPTDVEALILAHASRGDSAQKIFTALGGRVSERTISRRVDELRKGGAVSAYVSSVLSEAQIPNTGEDDLGDIPADAEAQFSSMTADMVDRWIGRIEGAAKKAEALENMAELGTLGRLMATLLEVKRKSTPIPKIDPNQSPDMLAAKDAAFTKLTKAVESEVAGLDLSTFRAGSTRTIADVAAHILSNAFNSLTTIECAALGHDWNAWGREKQIAPPGKWRLWGFLTGRGFGKTLSISSYINQEVEAGRAKLICLIAQDEQSSVDIQVNGPSGLIATAAHWCKPHFEVASLQLVWPNGARAYVRTPESPGKIRGLEYEITWASELQSWPVALRDEAWSNVLLSTRLGRAQVIWDSTPKKRHPILKDLIKDAENDPKKYKIVRGTTHENAANLGEGYVDELERKYGGTSKGKEELLGLMLEESENATVHQQWIDDRRRTLGALVRRLISIDPAVTSRQGSDSTGIVEAGLGVDGQAYVLGDYSGKHRPHEWSKLVLDHYIEGKCDLVVVETNKGGDLVTQNLRAAATERGLTVVVIGKAEKPTHVRGTVFVKEVHSRGEKQDRAQPVATSYERGRVSHVIGADLASLEDTLTTWEPTPGSRSPDDLDALVAAVTELLGLTENKPDAKIAFEGIAKVHAEITRPQAVPPSLMSLLGGGSSGGRI